MTAAWFLGAAEGVPQHESKVRSTVEPIRDDSTDAEQHKPPDWNELDTDSSGELVGLSPRVAGSDTIDTQKYPAWWIPLSGVNHNELVDNQVASSGTAASRESAGQQGHGTTQYAEGIEPVIRDGAAYGQDYFDAGEADIQEGSGHYMAPVVSDDWANSLAQNDATNNARRAAQSSVINSWFTQQSA